MLGLVCLLKGCVGNTNVVSDDFKAPTRPMSKSSSSINTYDSGYNTASESEGDFDTSDNHESSPGPPCLVLPNDEPIHAAVRENNISYLIRLIETDNINNNDSTSISTTNSFSSIFSIKKEIKLIDLQTLSTKNTPLHIASILNNENIIKFLLYKGANKKLRNIDGKLAKDLCDEKYKPYFNLKKDKLLDDNLKSLIKKEEIRMKNKRNQSILKNNGNVINNDINMIDDMKLTESPFSDIEKQLVQDHRLKPDILDKKMRVNRYRKNESNVNEYYRDQNNNINRNPNRNRNRDRNPNMLVSLRVRSQVN